MAIGCFITTIREIHPYIIPKDEFPNFSESVSSYLDEYDIDLKTRELVFKIIEGQK